MIPTRRRGSNHRVIVQSAAAAGPSGIAGEVCSVDGGADQTYTSGGVTVDGDGVHTITCTAWNRAVDPQGAPQYGSASETIDIDESPPSISFEPVNPADPTEVVADTADSESGVAGGSLQIALAGSNAWTSLPTSFDGSHLIADVDDSDLRGTYAFRATACDNVGNCTSTQTERTLPLREPTVTTIGLTAVDAPAKVVREKVLIDARYRLVRRHHLTVRVRTGGRWITVRLVIRRNVSCTHRLIRTEPRRWRELTACRPLTPHTTSSATVPFGTPTGPLHGLLTTSDGVPIAGATLEIQTAPDNGLGQFTPMALVTTGAGGTWSAILPPGPSSAIRAVYAGSATLLPASAQVSVQVPAKITLTIRPREVAWREATTISGHLAGGYVPPDGVALRLMVGYPGTSGVPVLAFRTDASGSFSIRWRYPAGRGVITLAFWVATTATESDYPFAASTSPRVKVTFGRRASSGPVVRPRPRRMKHPEEL